ncbi:hypothetical protein HIM_02662 [Hirsutella minnesotensis 3608]|nr:hypothetical protein HIM_02662 [Hirsutella minnesotensis 3608]
MVRASGYGLSGLLFLSQLCPIGAFYIPGANAQRPFRCPFADRPAGWSIKSYKDGDDVPLLVNKAYSDNTQLQYAYYDLPFVCPPTGRHRAAGGLLSGQSISLNLGEVLRGDRIVASDMRLSMGRDTACAALCTRELTRDDVGRARGMVRDGYVTEWIVDNLPGATSFVTTDKTSKYYAAGFKLGYADAARATGERRYFLHNHHTIVIRYRKAAGRAGDRGEKVVVGFEVYPKSIGSDARRDESGCPLDLQRVDAGLELRIEPNATAEAVDDESAGSLKVPYTYSVYFREDNSIEWAHRWDLYFVNQEEGSRIHWLAMINSLIICGVLTGVVTIILAKTVRTDIRGYRDATGEEGKTRRQRSRPDGRGAKDKAPGLLDQGMEAADDGDVSSDDEALEDVTGWKLLHADVFRKPRFGTLLAPMVGSGMQLLFMAVGLVLLGALGVLNPSFRGGFISVGVGLFIFAGLFSGYFSARVFRSFDGVDWRANALVTALLFPGLTFGLVFVLNLFVWAQASSTAIPFGTLVAMLALWLCVQVPLVLAGSRYGYHGAGAWEHPTKTAAIVQSVWQDKTGYYYVFGFLAVVGVILVVTVAEVTVVCVYVQLCAEDHRWWWQSFLVGAASAVWVFVFCVWYYAFKLHITGLVSSMLFFAYSFVACCMYGLLAGTVGFLSAYAFVRRIYGAIKVD